MFKKHLFTGIIVLMIFSLAGIILVQFFWVKHAFEVKEKQFDQSVNKALVQTVDRLAKDRHVSYVTNNIWLDDNRPVETLKDTIIWKAKDSHDNEDYSYVYVKENNSHVRTISVSSNDENAVITLDALKDPTFRYKTVLKLDSQKKKLHHDQYVVITEFRDSVDVIVQKKISEIASESHSLHEVIDDMVVEIESIENPVEESMDMSVINARLSESLEDKGISLEFEFGVYHPDSGISTSIQSEHFDLKKDQVYKTRLFPDRVIASPELIMVSFPGKRSHIIKSIGLLLSGSVFFTLIILLTFFITIRVILTQKKLSEIKSDFINNMTHEFKTPIATISLAVDSINNPGVLKSPEKIKYFTGVIGEENDRMNARVENVLQMSLIDKDDFNLNYEEVDAHELINKSISNIQLQLQQKEGELSTKFNAENYMLYTDKSHFINIITNLLDNAIKYAVEKPVLIISTFSNSNWFDIIVTDNGPGMTKEEQQKIFDKFYRVPSGDIHNVKGFGLGLSYVKAVVLAQKGNIEVNSKPGMGSEFKVSFPLTSNNQ